MTNENIVKRLRKWAKSAVKGGVKVLPKDLLEASDEIERLRRRCDEADRVFSTITGDQR